MKCICFSDSHGQSVYMKRALAKNPDAEVVFFLGDGLADYDYIMEGEWRRSGFSVRGNCDFGYSAINPAIKKTDEISLMGHKIVFTHGDLYGVKSGLADLVSMAIMRGADIVLFGHTHAPAEIYLSSDNKEYRAVYSSLRERGLVDADGPEKPLYLFNPGAISYHAIGLPSFGVMTLSDDGVLFSHGNER